VNDDLAYLGATETIERFRTRELSPVEVMEAVITASEATEPEINALTDTYFEAALEQAGRAAEAYANGTARPLEGLAVGIKDEAMVAGQRTTQGSLLFADHIADHTDPLPARVLEAGGIIHARTAAPEFSMAVVTWTFLHGITRNPWNLGITCGGSSGGTGASLAAGSSTLASGSDIGGSIRIPAAMNGLVGFKPPFGRNQDPWPWNREPYVASGPLGRSVADVIVFQNVVQGPLEGDMWSSPRFELPVSYPPIEGMSVAVSRDLGHCAPDAAVVAAVEAAAARLADLGARVEFVDLDWSARAREVALDHLTFLSGTILKSEIPPGRADELTPYIRDLLARPVVSVEEWIAGWEYADHMYADLERRVFAAGHDVLVCPATATTAIPADFGHPDTGDTVALERHLELVMTYPFNTLGRLPVVSMPIGIDGSTGVPIGMQIVGPVDRDDVPFRLAAGLEGAQGRFFDRHRPPLGGPGPA
jgi:Asp-tRNA(Asn)/Glu-tRNA(Gln) amidotransferase A subunit family amidase